MRFETINASYYLVSRLQYADAVTNIRDEGDIILLDLADDTQAMLLLIERGMSLSEIQYYYTANTRKGIATLMLLWVDMFIPSDGADYELADWMLALDSLHAGKLYGYEVAGRQAFFFPVYLEGDGSTRRIRYGNTVNFAHIGVHTVASDSPLLRGTWHVASFDHSHQSYADAPFDQRYRHGSPLAVYFEILGLSDGAELAAVKIAYRALARQHHPDTNDADDAHQQMAQINDAYQRIIQHLAE